MTSTVGLALVRDAVTIYEHDGASRIARRIPFRSWVRCGSAAAANDPRVLAVADVEIHAGDGYRYLLRPRLEYTTEDVRRALDDVGDAVIDKAEPTTSQCLIENELRYAAGLQYADLRVVALHVLIAQTDPSQHWALDVDANVVIAVSALSSDGKAFEWSLPVPAALDARLRQREQRAMIAQLCEFVRDSDPDVLVGYDLIEWVLPFLHDRAEGNLPLGRGTLADRHITVRSGGVTAAGRWRERADVTIPGREVIDLGDIDAQENRGRRRSLAEFAAAHGVTANREDAGAAAELVFRPRAYGFANALDIAREQVAAVLDLSARVVPAYLVVARNVPVTLGAATRIGSGSLVDLAMTAAYHRAHFALPFRVEKTDFGGPRAELLFAGRVERVYEADFDSFYPMLIINERIGPASDHLDVFVPLVEELVHQRLAAKKVACDDTLTSSQRALAQATSDGLKLVVNSFYGALGSAGFHFGDMRAAGRVARIGEEVLDAFVCGLEDEGAEVVQFQTDGVRFRLPDSCVDDVQSLVGRVRDRTAPAYPISIDDHRKTTLFVQPEATGCARLDVATETALPTKGRLMRGVDLPEALRVPWALTVEGVVRGEHDALRHVADAVRALRGGVYSTDQLAFVGLRTPADVRDDPFQDATARAIAHARSHGPAVVAGRAIRWYVSRPVGGAESWIAGARLVGSPEPPDAEWYVTKLARHVEAMEGAVGRAAIDAALRGEVVDADVAGPRRVGWLGGGLVHWPHLVKDGYVALPRPTQSGKQSPLLLGVARTPAKHSEDLRRRVRLGNLLLLASPTLSADDATTAITAAREMLVALGADAAALKRVHAGARPGVVIEASALALPQLANLPAVHAAVVVELTKELRRTSVPHSLPKGVLFDPSIYTVDAISPLDAADVDALVPHAGVATSSLTALGQLVARTRVTLGWRRVGHEPRGVEARGAADRKRDAKRGARLAATGVVMRAPCVEAIEALLTDGAEVSDRLIDKFKYEALSHLGDDAERIAQVIADAHLTATRRKRHVRVLDDGVYLRASDRRVGCGGAEVAEVCRRGECWRSGQVPEEDAPSFPAFGEMSQTKIAGSIRMLEIGKPRFVSASIRGRKTTNAAQLAAKYVRDGMRVVYAVPTHRAGDVFLGYLDSAGFPKGRLAVHLYGKHGAACRVPSRAGCHGCDHDTIVAGHAHGVLAADAKKAKRWVGTFGFEEIDKRAATTTLCVRSMSRAMAGTADIVVLTFESLARDGVRQLIGDVDLVIVDEADQLPEVMINRARVRLPLASARTSAKQSFRKRECSMRCEGCHLDFVHRPGEKNEPTFTADESCAASDTNARPVVLIDALRGGIAELRAGSAAARDLDLDAVERNIDLLATALIDPGALSGASHTSPQSYLIALGRHLLRPPPLDRLGPIGTRALDELAPHEPAPVWLRFDGCSNGVSPRDASDSVELLYRFATFTTMAAASGGALLDARPRPGGWAHWQPSCSLDLSFIAITDITELRQWFGQRRTLFLSGSFVDPVITAELLGFAPGDYETADATVPLHRDVHILAHSVDATSDSPTAAKPITPKDFAQILVVAGALGRVHGRRRALRVLVFANSKDEARGLAGALHHDNRVRVELVLDQDRRETASSVEPATKDVLVDVVVEHLRSPGSRARDREFDVVVVSGNGRPSFGDVQAAALALEQSMQIRFDGSELADESRLRAVSQAALRHAGLPGRRVALLIGDIVPADLPAYIRSRARSTSTLFSAPVGDPVPTAERQVAAIAMAIAELLRSGKPGLCGLSWPAVAALHPLPTTPRQLRGNVAALAPLAARTPARRSAAIAKLNRGVVDLLLLWGVLHRARGGLDLVVDVDSGFPFPSSLKVQ